FKTVFWDVSEDYIGYASKNHGEFYLFINCVPVSGKPVLMSLISGTAAEQLEKKSEREIIDKVASILSKIFKNKVTTPTDWLITRWKADQFSRGSYSYVAVDSTGDDYDCLAESLDELLFFAGEATIRVLVFFFFFFFLYPFFPLKLKSNNINFVVVVVGIICSFKKWPASAHGAFLSGIREARKIIHSHYEHEFESDSVISPTVKKIGLTKNPIDIMYSPATDTLLRASTRHQTQRAHGNDSEASTTPKTEVENDDVISLKVCNLCHLPQESAMFDPLLGPFVESAQSDIKCAQYSPEIQVNREGQFQNVIPCIKRSQLLKVMAWVFLFCASCYGMGASVGCHNECCARFYHPICAVQTNWDFERPDEGEFFFCAFHRELALFVTKDYKNQTSFRSKKPHKSLLRGPNRQLFSSHTQTGEFLDCFCSKKKYTGEISKNLGKLITVLHRTDSKKILQNKCLQHLQFL
ncbi:lysine-specific histone demethylase Aof2, partial [Reticulomyxa filosa]